MATWKKIIVSGSNAHLAQITSSVLTVWVLDVTHIRRYCSHKILDEILRISKSSTTKLDCTMALCRCRTLLVSMAAMLKRHSASGSVIQCGLAHVWLASFGYLSRHNIGGEAGAVFLSHRHFALALCC